MTHFLSITVRYLDPTPAFHGRRDGGEPEWPPSPLRLFQALLDAAANRWRNETFQDYAKPALAWLERLPLPILVTPKHWVGKPYRLAVPNNDMDSPAAVWARGQEPVKPHRPVDLRTMKTVRPTHLLGTSEDENAVHYLFPLPENRNEFERHRGTLQAAASSITHLGWGIDIVTANASVISEEQVAKLPGEAWRPSPDGQAPGLRAPISGTLDALTSKHEAFLNRLGPDGFKPVPPLSAFRVVGYRRDRDPIQRPFSAFRLLDPDTGKPRSFPATRALTVAGMIRGAAHQAALAADRDVQWVGEFVCGHHDGPDSFPRFSYLVLPSIQPVVGVGRISRVLVAEPLGSDGKETAWIRRLLAGRLAQNEQGQHALLVPLPRDDNVLRDYVRTSQTWTSVTPVALPGSDDGTPRKTAKLLRKMFRHAGYSSDAVDELEYHRVPFLRGAEDAKRYRPEGGHYLSNCTMYHMRIRWKCPMSGPIALGAGRHCGLGVFAAIS